MIEPNTVWTPDDRADFCWTPDDRADYYLGCSFSSNANRYPLLQFSTGTRLWDWDEQWECLGSMSFKPFRTILFYWTSRYQPIPPVVSERRKQLMKIFQCRRHVIPPWGGLILHWNSPGWKPCVWMEEGIWVQNFVRVEFWAKWWSNWVQHACIRKCGSLQ